LENVPLTISHRGVSQGNGVQNTVESLEKTALLKPDYIEMDVQETKDGQFVMMHDANLKALAGVDAKPQEADSFRYFRKWTHCQNFQF